VVHREEADRTLVVASADAVEEAGVHHLSHQRPVPAEVKAKRGDREQNERSHRLRLIPVGVRAGVRATTVTVKYQGVGTN